MLVDVPGGQESSNPTRPPSLERTQHVIAANLITRRDARSRKTLRTPKKDVVLRENVHVKDLLYANGVKPRFGDQNPMDAATWCAETESATGVGLNDEPERRKRDSRSNNGKRVDGSQRPDKNAAGLRKGHNDQGNHETVSNTNPCITGVRLC